MYGKLNTGKLRSQNSVCSRHRIALRYYTMSLCFFLISLFLLSNVSNPHAPTLKHRNPLCLGSWQKSPQKGGSRQDVKLESHWVRSYRPELHSGSKEKPVEGPSCRVNDLNQKDHTSCHGADTRGE